MFFRAIVVYTEARAKSLLKYLKEQIKDLDEIEIWTIWLDDNESESIKLINIAELRHYIHI